MKIAIIGAGMAGLAAARALQGHEVTLFEKSRGVGGRAATRRRDGFIWDTGATVIPHELASRFGDAGLVAIEKPVWIGLPPTPGNRTEARFAHPGGITAFAKFLAQGLDIRFETRIENVEALLEEYDYVIVTAPVAQARDLVARPGMDASAYRHCFSVFLGFAAPLPEVPYSALLSRGQAVEWISLETEKVAGRAPAGHAGIVCQLSADYSREHYDDPHPHIVGDALSVVNELFALGEPIVTDVMRWRYSQPTELADFDTVNLPGSRLLFAGDGFAGGKLHLAYACGEAVAERVLSESQASPASVTE